MLLSMSSPFKYRLKLYVDDSYWFKGVWSWGGRLWGVFFFVLLLSVEYRNPSNYLPVTFVVVYIPYHVPSLQSKVNNPSLFSLSV